MRPASWRDVPLSTRTSVEVRASSWCEVLSRGLSILTVTGRFYFFTRLRHARVSIIPHSPNEKPENRFLTMMRLLFVLAALVSHTVVVVAEHRDCPYDIVIGMYVWKMGWREGLLSELMSTNPHFPSDNQVVNSLKCFDSPPYGISARVTGNFPEGVVIWDSDAPCGEGKAYIHYAGSGNVKTMTAGAGPLMHTYRAAFFDELPVMQGAVGCAEFRVKFSSYCKTEWQVARHGTSCADVEGFQ